MGILLNPYRFAAASPGLVQPSDIANLELWLKGSGLSGGEGDSVSTWADSSGHGRNAIEPSPGAGPVLNLNQIGTRPAVHFNGSTYLTLPDFLTGFTAGEIFIRVKLDNDPPLSLGESGFWNLGASTDYILVPYIDGKIYDSFGSTVRKDNISHSLSMSSTYRLYNVTSKAGGWTNRMDGVELFTTATNTVGWNASPTLGLQVGKAGMTGRVAEVFIFSRELTSTERTDMTTYGMAP